MVASALPPKRPPLAGRPSAHPEDHVHLAAQLGNVQAMKGKFREAASTYESALGCLGMLASRRQFGHVAKSPDVVQVRGGGGRRGLRLPGRPVPGRRFG